MGPRAWTRSAPRGVFQDRWRRVNGVRGDVHPVRAGRRGVRQRVAASWSEPEEGGRMMRIALGSAERLYRIVVGARNGAYDRRLLRAARLSVPVVSVGNLAVGGAGKTPVAAWLATELTRRGFAPAVLHGGYGADEPALHRQWNPGVPVIVGRDRVAGGRRAIAEGATVLVLDDGFQHRRLARDIDVVLVAAETWSRDTMLLPRGPWREGAAALARATLVIVTRKTAAPGEAAEVGRDLCARVAGLAAPVGLALLPAGWQRADGAATEPRGAALAVAGVALPDLFAANARETGVVVDQLIVYPDHHEYQREDAEQIRRIARDRPIITTEKDWVKLVGLLDPQRVWLLRQDVQLEEGATALHAALDTLGR